MRTVVQERSPATSSGCAPSVQEALGELISAAKDGRWRQALGSGSGVLTEVMEPSSTKSSGRRASATPYRVAVRHGHEDGELTLGEHGVGVQRPRARTVNGSGEVPLGTHANFADRDPLTRVALGQVLAGVSTRGGSRAAREPVGQGIACAERSTSTSAVSREFGRTSEHVRAHVPALADVRLAALMGPGRDPTRCAVPTGRAMTPSQAACRTHRAPLAGPHHIGGEDLHVGDRTNRPGPPDRLASTPTQAAAMVIDHRAHPDVAAG